MEKILDLYRKKRSMYHNFTHEMQELITVFLMNKNIRIHSIVSRVKEEASLKNKINKKSYTCLEEITDLCGIRIITYFSDDVDLIADIIQKSFAIDPVNSVDKRKLLPATQFGYLSLHFIAGLTTTQLQLPQYKKFENCKFEIQICSVLQHAWAEIEHDLEYKSPTAISYNVRRSFSRLAGLLEIADAEFVMLRNHLQPSPLLETKANPVSLQPYSQTSARKMLSETCVQKVPRISSLWVCIEKYCNSAVFKTDAAYTTLVMIVALLIAHLMNLSHYFHAITAYIHTEKSLLFSLVRSCSV